MCMQKLGAFCDFGTRSSCFKLGLLMVQHDSLMCIKWPCVELLLSCLILVELFKFYSGIVEAVTSTKVLHNSMILAFETRLSLWSY